MIYTIIIKEISKQEFINTVLGPHINNGDIEISQYVHSMPNLIRVIVKGNFNIRTMDTANIVSLKSSITDNMDSLIENHMIWEQDIETVRIGENYFHFPPSNRSDLQISTSTTENNIIYDAAALPGDTQLTYCTFKGVIRTPDYTGPTVATNWGFTRCTLPNEDFASGSIASASSLPATPPVPIDEVSTYLEWSLDFDESEDPSTSGTTGDYEITSDPQGYLPVYGCTDPESYTYNPLAEIDDGSCEYVPAPILGCTDETANNYDSTATIDDGTCNYTPDAVYGCTDPTAINYDPTANVNDYTCEYGDPIIGCMDPAALNYNANADQESGLCIYPSTDTVNEIDTQIITLIEGWNIISTYIDVSNIGDGDVREIFKECLRDQHGNTIAPEDIVDYIHIVKNNNADVYWPEFDFQGIGSWNANEGYQVRTHQLCQLQITGPIIQSMTMEMIEGWNIIAYPFINSIYPEVLFEGLHDVVQLLKDNDAHVWWPEFEFNGMGQMLPGQGYQLRCHEAFTIPVSNTVNISNPPVVLENQYQEINIDVNTIISLKSVFSSWIDNSNTTVKYIFENYSKAFEASGHNNEVPITPDTIGKYIKQIRNASTQEIVYSPTENVGDIYYDIQTGYTIEWLDEINTLQSFNLRIPGNTMIHPTYNIVAGENYLPVPVNRELNPEEIFAEHVAAITQLKDLNTGLVWWPRFNSNRIGNMVPGNLYLLVANNSFSVDVPSA
jgi:hypothetical protein